MLDHGQIQKQINILNNGSEAARRDAITAMKQHDAADIQALPADITRSLVSALRHMLPKASENGGKAPLFRQEVATVLGNIGIRAEAALPQLVDLLDDGIPDAVREATATALGKIGKESKIAVDKLIAILNSSCRIALADRVARALGDIGCADQRVRTALVNLWLVPTHSQSNQVQVAIALCKLRIEAPGLLKSLTATLVTSRDSSLRKASAEALYWCGKNDLDVVPALTAALYDEDEEVRNLAQRALDHMKLSRPKAIQICASQLKESVHAEAALRKSGQQSVPSLIEALSSKEALAREKAARTLGSIGEVAAEAVPALTSALKGKDIAVRLSVAKGLWNVSKKPEAVVPVLADLLGKQVLPKTEDPETRRRFLQSVIESLCRIGINAKAAVPALTRMVKDDNRLIRESAQRALKEIGPVR